MIQLVLLTTNLAQGGAEAQVAQLAKGLRRREWPVALISLLPPSAFEDELASSGVPIYSLGMRPGSPNPLGLARLAILLRKLRPQILHSHMFHANLLARVVRLFCPVPVVISTLHSIAETSRESGDVSGRDRLYRLTDSLVDAVTAVSAAAADRHIEAKAVCRAKVRIIPNGVDTTKFRPDPDLRARMRQELGLRQEFAWLAVGRLMWKKDYAIMLRAFARLQQGILLIAGAGPQESDLRALAGDLSIEVRFLGQRSDISTLMNAADGFVLSSLIEGLPVALLEAASCGLPCVATQVGGVPGIVLPEQTGALVPPGDPEALAGAMSRLMSKDPGAREAMGRAARSHAVSNFDSSAIIAQWERAYLELYASAGHLGVKPRLPAEHSRLVS